MRSAFYLCFSNSLNVAIFILLLALLEPYVKKYLSAVCLYRLWIILLLGLLLPLRIDDHNALFCISLPRIAVEDKADYGEDRNLNDGLGKNDTHLALQETKNADDDLQSGRNNLFDMKRFIMVNAAILNRNGNSLLILLWIIGFVILAKQGIGHYMYIKRLKRFATPLCRKELLEVYQQCIHEFIQNKAKSFLTKNTVAIYQCSIIQSPMTIGIFRQVILLPYEEYSSKDFYFIIKHELIHIQRRDSIIKLLRMIVLSLNWYNPFCYLLSRHMDEWCEASCDELVIYNSTRSECLYYGNLLLKYAIPKENRAFTVNMIGGKKYMKNRLNFIAENRKKRSGNILILAFIFVVFTVAIVSVHHAEEVTASINGEEGQSVETVNEPSAASEASITDGSLVAPGNDISSPEEDVINNVAADEASTPDALREKVVEYALDAQSAQYVWGGNDLSAGVDSSGFVQAIYKKMGYELPRTSREQADEYNEISLEDLKLGDLIFYGREDEQIINHVAIYIGEKKVIHASNMRDGVKISDYDYRPMISAARVITG
jgi:beta-lactamase regulating signal transducer with metallopeptidase domain